MILTDAPMRDNNALLIKRCKREPMAAPIASWVNLIEELLVTVHLTDTNLV